MTKGLAWGLGACSLAGAMLASAAHAVPAQDVAGFGGVAGSPGFGPTHPSSELRAVNTGRGIPVGGAILITGGGTTTAPIVEVADEETLNTTIGGTVRQFEDSQYWIWVPSQPFVEGRTYQVRLSAADFGFFGVTETFEAMPAITLSPPLLVSEPSLSSVDETIDTECCRQFFGAGVLEQGRCFASEQRRSVLLNPGLSTPDPAMLLGQFLFRITPGAGADVSQPPQPTQWPTWVPVLFYEQAAQYCFEVEAIELVSGTVHAYTDISLCVPHGQLPPLGIEVIEPGIAELDRTLCQAPPLAYEERWCELNADPCASDANATGCLLYGFVCRDEALPPDPMATAGGFAGFQSVEGSGGASSRGNAGVAGPSAGAAGFGGRSGSTSSSEDGGSNDGCSIAGRPGLGRGTGALVWWASAVALFAARRRTSASRALRK